MLFRSICPGGLAPGAHLVQEQIASRLGVSRQPVIQAFALLKTDGLLREEGARGLFVTPLDREATRARYDIRRALDELAARRAAEQARRSPETAGAIARDGRALCENAAHAIARSDTRELVRLDIAFHRFVYDVSGNPLIAQTAEPHWRFLRRVMSDVLRDVAPQTIWTQHKAILDSIVAGHTEEAALLAGRHVLEAAERLPGVFGGAEAGR